MQKPIASGLAAVGMAAIFVFPPAYGAHARSYRGDWADRPEMSVSQGVDRADARIANLKADLRLSDDQAKSWPGLETTLHDIASYRAKRWADNRALQSGRSASEKTAAPPAAPPANDAAARRAPDARANQPDDDVTAMLRRSDALAGQSAELKQIADAARPLYNSLDDRQRQRFVQFVSNYMVANEAEDWRERR